MPWLPFKGSQESELRNQEMFSCSQGLLSDALATLPRLGWGDALNQPVLRMPAAMPLMVNNAPRSSSLWL